MEVGLPRMEDIFPKRGGEARKSYNDEAYMMLLRGTEKLFGVSEKIVSPTK